MDLFLKGWVFLALCYVTMAATTPPYSPTPNNQYGRSAHFINGTILETRIAIFKMDSPITRVYFTDPTLVELYADRPGCGFTGTGTDSDPFVADIMIDTATNAPPPGEPDCGVILTRLNEGFYQWMLYSQKTPDYVEGGNAAFVVNINISAALPYNVSTTVVKRIPGITNIPTSTGTATITPINAVDSMIQAIDIGNDFYLRLRYQPNLVTEGNVTNDLAPWGAYCKTLYATPDSNFRERIVYLIDDNGCPRPDAIIFPDVRLEGTKPVLGELYRAISNPIRARYFDKVSNPSNNFVLTNSVYFVCEAEFCWTANDHNCLDRCAANTVRRRRQVAPVRRRREEEALIELDTKRLTTKLTVIDNGQDQENQDTQNKKQDDGGLSKPLIFGLVGGISFFILLIILIIVIMKCYCGGPEKTERKNSFGSKERLDRHTGKLSHSSYYGHSNYRY